MYINLNLKKLIGFRIINTTQLMQLPGTQLLANKNDKFREKGNNSNVYSLSFKIQSGNNLLLILQIIELPWLCELDWYHDIWFEYSVYALVERFWESSINNKILLDSQGLYLHAIEHERGDIIICENSRNFVF
jgi:hypothetical protein